MIENFELTELFGARDASCPKGKKMYERQRKIRICEQGGKINDSDIIHINDSVHKHYLVFGKIGVCNSKQES